MSTAVLNVKISAELKDQIRLHAEQNNETLSAITEKLLSQALFAANESPEPGHEDIDNQHTEEEDISPLNHKEIKALRKLLKKKK
ncbi:MULTISPECIES: hypothetical protein [Franconibacter]|uniref:Arc-like DNA binding domain-containing protein n=1 Tax=Franconibacter daqui TaxID=2047724 RepID=A0ABV1PP69_9ENTR|nr:hypothetical protein [Franconibacter sp. IITDAS19]MCK1967076.1 hypothetical protein [Franconibacter sp. IITDAS19]